MRKWQFILGVILAGVIIFGMTLRVGYQWGYRDAYKPITPIKVQTEYHIQFEDKGYILSSESGVYELKYINHEGWFLIKDNIMYRLEVWLEEHTPDARYTFEYYINDYGHGTISIYFARP